jgi:hypothetical protein
MAGHQVPGTSSSATVLALDVVWRCCRISSGLVAFFLDLGKGHDAGGLKCVAAHRRCVSRPADGGEEAVADGTEGRRAGWIRHGHSSRGADGLRRQQHCVFFLMRDGVPSDESVGL